MFRHAHLRYNYLRPVTSNHFHRHISVRPKFKPKKRVCQVCFETRTVIGEILGLLEFVLKVVEFNFRILVIHGFKARF